MEKEKMNQAADEKKKPAYITFSEKMIASRHQHTDPSKIDINTGEVMKICSVKLPSKQFRNHRFGKDSNGIDRDEREATINLVDSYIFENKDKEGNHLNYYSYLDPDRNYNINFKGKIIGQEEGKNIFDKPEKAVLTGSQLTDMYRESRQISKQLRLEKEAKATEKKEKETEKTTKKSAKKQTKSKSSKTRNKEKAEKSPSR